jgi:hypothetical protein
MIAARRPRGFQFGPLLCNALLLLIASGLACGGDTTGANAVPPCCISLSLPNMMLTVIQGLSINVPVTLTRTNNYTAAVTLSASDVPTGVTATFNPATLSGATLTSTLTITAATDAPTASAVLINIKGVTTDSLDARVFVTLNVIMPRVNVTLLGTGAGTVTSSPTGINCGTACGAGFPLGTDVTLTATAAANSAFAGWSGGCTNSTGTCTVNARGTIAVTATFNSTAPTFSFSVTPTTVTTPQGGSGTATVAITRSNGFAGAVNLAVAGAPSGLTVTPNPASVTGNSATINIAAALSVGVSNYPLTITATGTGVAQQTAPLNVQVTPGQGGSGNITLSLGTCDPTGVPIWFAAQNGNGPWTRVAQGANNAFTFTIGANGAFAYVTQDGTNFSTQVIYLTGAEATSIALGSLCAITPQTGTKQLTGTVANVSSSPPLFWTLVIGGATARNDGAGGPPQPFGINGVPAGARDLVAARLAPNTNLPGVNGVQRMILRRNTNYPNAGSIPVLNFNSAEAVTPVQHFILLNNLGSDASGVEESLITSNGATSPFFTSAGNFSQNLNSNVVRYFPFPESLLSPSDLHQLFIFAGNETSARFAALYLRQPSGDTTVTFGPSLTMPTVTSLGTTPYLRLRAQLPSQSAYNSAVSFAAEQGGRDVEVSITAAHLGGAPATWRMDVPDLSSAGYDANWGLRTGAPVAWGVTAVGGNVLPFIGATPSDGVRIVGAGASGSSTAFSQTRQLNGGYARTSAGVHRTSSIAHFLKLTRKKP